MIYGIKILSITADLVDTSTNDNHPSILITGWIARYDIIALGLTILTGQVRVLEPEEHIILAQIRETFREIIKTI